MQNGLIDRKQLRMSLKREECKKIGGKLYVRMSAVLEKLRIAPTIDAVPVAHGRWVRANDEQAYFDVEYICSGCQFAVAVSGIGTPILHGYHYCPNCGAKMDVKGG